MMTEHSGDMAIHSALSAGYPAAKPSRARIAQKRPRDPRGEADPALFQGLKHGAGAADARASFYTRAMAEAAEALAVPDPDLAAECAVMAEHYAAPATLETEQ